MTGSHAAVEVHKVCVARYSVVVDGLACHFVARSYKILCDNRHYDCDKLDGIAYSFITLVLVLDELVDKEIACMMITIPLPRRESA